ncbi:MAG: Uncharacterized protein FD147_1454, partial [Chloroflexi bacterium]
NSPQGPEKGTTKVFRGGSYQSLPDEIGAAQRFSIEPAKHAADLGFRCVLTGEPPIPPPPPCQVMAINKQPSSQPTFTPFPPCDPALVGAFCSLIKGIASVGITFAQSNCFDNTLEEITADGIPMNCEEIPSAPTERRYLCSGTNLAQGALIDIEYCHFYGLPMIEPVCLTGYEYNHISGFCEPSGSWLPDPPCPDGYKEFLDFGCLPDYWYGGCPVGYYTIIFGSTAVCFPMDECLLPNPPESCNPPICPDGETYDSGRQCCVTPEKPRQRCPIGFSYNEEFNICLIPNLNPPCMKTHVKIPNCPTPTLTPTKPPDQLIPCSAYTSPNTCPVPRCDWRRPPTGGNFGCYPAITPSPSP